MNRRGFLRQLGLVIAAPAIVRATSLMKVVPWDEPMVVIPWSTDYRTAIPALTWRMLNQGLPYPDDDIIKLMQSSNEIIDEALYETL